MLILAAFVAARLVALSVTPTINYSLHLDAAHPDVAEIAIQLSGVPTSFHLAMKIHAEYDARYWRFMDGFRIDGTGASISREDSTLWRVTLADGRGVIHYRVHIQPPEQTPRRAWQPYARADGALINPPDFFLYLPELANVAVTVDLDVPREWRVATALPARGRPTHFGARDAATLLDSPIMLGALREWSFAESGTRYHVVYWPLPDATPFDTVALVDALHRIARAANGVFGGAPTSNYWFLLQDGAGDALEHLESSPRSACRVLRWLGRTRTSGYRPGLDDR